MKLNPVLKKESKLTVRTIKFPFMICLYTSIVLTIVISIFNNIIRDAYFSGYYLSFISRIYKVMAIVQGLLIILIVPALSATAICGEREKQTLEILLSTKIRPISIIIGKLSSSVSLIILLIICSIPFYSIVFFIGGISIINIFELSLYFIITTIFIGTISIFISTITKTSKVAISLSFGAIFLMFGAVIIMGYIYMNIKGYRFIGTAITIPKYMYICPTVGFFSLLSAHTGSAQIGSWGYMLNISKESYLISIVVEIVLSGILVISSAYLLNPLKIIWKKK